MPPEIVQPLTVHHIIHKHQYRAAGERKEFHMKLFKTPKELIAAISVAGAKKSQLSVVKTLLAGILAGLLLGFGCALSLIVGGGVPLLDPGLQKFLFGAMFPFGLLLIVATGSELFTGNTMYMPAALLTGRTTWKKLAMNWSLVYAGNFVGALIASYFLIHLTGIVAVEPLRVAAIAVGEKKAALGFGEDFLRGVACNWLVNLALWTATVAEDTTGKYIGIWFFVTCGFEHSIANMSFIPIAMMGGANVSVNEFLIVNLLPVTLGNVIVGVVSMALVYYYMYLWPLSDNEACEKRKEIEQQAEAIGLLNFSNCDDASSWSFSSSSSRRCDTCASPAARARCRCRRASTCAASACARGSC